MISPRPLLPDCRQAGSAPSAPLRALREKKQNADYHINHHLRPLSSLLCFQILSAKNKLYLIIIDP
jgi:hypothetical protein